jgi:hypothetical protein
MRKKIRNKNESKKGNQKAVLVALASSVITDTFQFTDN